MSPPNVLFILTDQQLKRCLGFTGDADARTPNLDALAAEGTVFRNVYTTCPACTPARASLQTGLYPFAHGMQTNLFMKGCMLHELPDSPDLLPRRLQAAGVTPILTGKWHLGFGPDAREDPYYRQHIDRIDHHLTDVELPAEYHAASGLPSDRGYFGDDFPGHGGGGHDYPQFLAYLRTAGLSPRLRHDGPNHAEVLSGPECTIDRYLADRAIHLIDTHARDDAPFFCMLNFWGPHTPAFVPTEFFEPFRDAHFDPWPSWDIDPSTRPRIHHATRSHGKPWADFERELRYAYAYTSFIDHEIGRVLEHLRRTGQLDNTTVIFSADHGDSMGIQAGLSNKSFHFYETAAGVPLFIRPAGGRGSGRRDCDAMVSLVDVPETICDLMNAPPPQTPQHGRSLRPWLQEDTPDGWPDDVACEGSGLAHCLMSQRMYRRGDWKYVFNAGDLDELYHLGEDPHELHNLAVGSTSHPPELNELREGLADWMNRHGDQILGQYQQIIHYS
ncbi:MAG: sulfatase-like hydrolase/transferase [Planctomycetota bacterium]